VSLLLRIGPRGDLFGLRRGGLNLEKLAENPHGIVLAEHLAPDVMRKQIRQRTRKVRLDPPEILEDAERLAARNGHDPEFPLRLIGLRELRSHNSWMHNAPLLMRGGRTHSARIHPDDASAVGISDGEAVRISSPHGSIEIAATVTDEVKRGTIAVPHGWGHTGGWQLAASAGGANVNSLTSSNPDDLERLAGMAHLNGVPVRLEAVATAPTAKADAGIAAPA
jgi:anaerobic selenocysteine-containing dehydrogenase